jgi:hypothetical protein
MPLCSVAHVRESGILWVPSTQQLFTVFVLLGGQYLFDNLYMKSKVMQDQ